MDGYGFSNAAHCECLLRRLFLGYVVLTTERLTQSSNKTVHLNYKGELANTMRHLTKKADLHLHGNKLVLKQLSTTVLKISILR